MITPKWFPRALLSTAAAIVFSITPPLEGQRIDLVGHIGGYSYATAIQGDYAYVGFGPDLVVVNVADPTNPKRVGRPLIMPSVVRSVVVAEDLAYVTDWGGTLGIVDISVSTEPSLLGSIHLWSPLLALDVVGEHVYLAAGQAGLVIVDASNPATPAEIGSLDTPGNAMGVAVADEYAFIADGLQGGLRIVDVSVPSRPYEVTDVATSGSANGIDVAGEHAFLVDGANGLLVFDIADPESPTEVASLDALTSAHGVTVNGERVYLADADGIKNRVRIVDVSQPTEPMALGHYQIAVQGVVFPWHVATEGKTAYVAAVDGGLRIVDVGDPAGPTELGSYDLPGRVHDVAVTSDRAYVADSASGLWIVDIANPAQPREIGHVASVGSAIAVAARGNYAYVAAGAGLHTVDTSNPESPSEIGVYLPPDDQRVWGLALDGDYAYVAAGSAGLRVLDLSGSPAPIEIGAVDTPAFAMEVVISQGHAYVADGAGLVIVDISDPREPRLLSSLPVPGLGCFCDVAVSGRFAYAIKQAVAGPFIVIDVADPRAPQLVGEFSVTGWQPYAVALLGNNVFVADWWGAVVAMDIGQPSATHRIAEFDTLGHPQHLTASEGLLYASDDEGGLFILRPHMARTLHFPSLSK